MIKFICDGCEKEVPGTWYPAAQTVDKPQDWFVRSDEQGEQHACSRDCVDKIAEKTGVTKIVAPF